MIPIRPNSSCHSRGLVHLLFVFAILVLGIGIPASGPALAVAPMYYVDCVSGSDSNNGMSSSTAWKSLTKANNASLVPGASLLFKRGCTWSGTLKAYWHGTATARILLGAYGSGNLPRIQNSAADVSDKYHNNVDISGSYLIIEYIDTLIVNSPVDPNCGNNPVGFYVGFSFRNTDGSANGGSYNIVRYSKASGHMAGIHFNNNSHHNQILNNTISGNRAMNVLTPVSVSSTDDIGAFGILLKGSNHEIAYNYLSNNVAYCTYDTPPQGNAIEVYEARDNSIHHNTSVEDRVFSELGGSSGYRADNNVYSYNLVVSSRTNTRFIVARGAGNSFGPTYRTIVYNNTVYFTGAGSQALVCHAGCSTSTLTAKNNVLWAVEKSAYADAEFMESNNLYWSTNGAPVVQFVGFSMSSSSKIANPRFVDPAIRNFRLQSTSPAIDTGVSLGLALDLDGAAVPLGSAPDMGGYEYGSCVHTATAMDNLTGRPVVQSGHTLFLPIIVRCP